MMLARALHFRLVFISERLLDILESFFGYYCLHFGEPEPSLRSRAPTRRSMYTTRSLRTFVVPRV
jgi:hypothetical protein